jgi:hypothetical protein
LATGAFLRRQWHNNRHSGGRMTTAELRSEIEKATRAPSRVLELIEQLLDWYTADSYLYVIGGATGPVKLGRSRDPLRRLADLQLSSPIKLDLIVAVPEKIFSEAAAHERFASQRLHGEWFQRSHSMNTWIGELRENYGTRLLHQSRVLRALEKAARPRRPLLHLRAVEATIREERRERERSQVRQLEIDAGCAMCGEKEQKLSRLAKVAPGLFCMPCRSWLMRIDAHGEYGALDRVEQRHAKALRGLIDFQYRSALHGEMRQRGIVVFNEVAA